MERSDANSHPSTQATQQITQQSEYQVFHAAFQHHHQQLSMGGPHTSTYAQHIGGSHPNYSWQGVMEFLRDQELKAMEREQKLINDKKNLEDRVKNLEEELSKQIQLNKDLVKKIRLIEYQMLQQKKKVRNHQNSIQLSGVGTIGATSGSNGGQNIASSTVGSLHGGVNPNLIKRPRHQRGNSDGIQNIASRLFTGNHTRGSSGSNGGQNKTFEENLDAGVALLSQTLELVQEAAANNSRTMAHTFHNHFPSHNKTNSSDTQETIESQQQLTKVYKQLETAPSKQFLHPTPANVMATIPQKRRQISNGSQISQQLQMTHDNQQQKQQIAQANNQQIAQAANPNNQVTITTTTTITSSSAPKSGEMGQRRKWLVQESVIAQDQTMVEQQLKISADNNQQNMNSSGQSQRMSTSQQARSKASQLSQVIQMQERFSKVEKSGGASNLLNTSSNSAISGGKKSHQGKRILFQSKCTLKSHLDAIRGIHFVSGTNALVSSSEDCTLKVWDANKFCSLKEVEGVINFEPYITLRGHLSPILSLSGNEYQSNTTLDNIVISGSKNGQLKAWNIPQSSTIDTYGPNKEQSYCVATWDNAHNNEPIWDIRLHPYENIFLSLGSDQSVGLWQVPVPNISQSFIEDNSLESSTQSTLLGRFKRQQSHLSSTLGTAIMPTSCSWLYSDPNSFVVSYQDPFISIFDASTGKEKGFINFQYDGQKPHQLQQINKIMVSESQKLLIAGTEDNLIRLFDLQSNKQVKTIVAHTDSITSLLIHKKSTQQMFISGGHDGAVRAWDLRTFQCIFDAIAHRRKYDEGVLSLASSDKFPLIASGGADCVIKIMHEQ